MAINEVNTKLFMGRRPRCARPVRRITVIVGSESIDYDLDASERLEDRRAAKLTMKALKPMADKIIQQQVTIPQFSPVQSKPATMLSMKHFTLFKTDNLESPPPDFPLCVSLVADQLTVVPQTSK